jgi:predicted methyltransferase
MEEYTEVIYDITTGTKTVRNYSPQEIAEVEAMKTKTANEIAATEKAENERIAAQAKLTALGLTTDDLKALGL